MKTRNVILFLLAAFFITTSADAQLLKKLKQAAEDGVQEAVERRVAHEIEKAAQKQTDRYLEQIFGPPTQYEGAGYDYSEMLKGIDLNVETEDSYHFEGFTDMEISGTDEKGKEIDPTQFRTFMSTNAEVWAMQLETDDKDLERTVMIFDNTHKATIMLLENKKGEKSRVAYGLDWSKMMDSSIESTMDSMKVADFNITKTGNTKTIMGYTCNEYQTETDEYTARYWVSEEPIQGYSSYWSKNNFLFSQQMKKKYATYFDQLPEGDVLEMNYVSKTGDGDTTMKIIEINTTENFDFVMADYENGLEQTEEQ
ncbi:DUF4412 domain-containing protein [Fulvivirga sedimenti]|uniref:DUF4412 domain-containing protein n=1 Tax=Fulvivirga sedimenti TaxID=2879465 RepID=A0A9X1HPA8_9BACT|nr:DUF4412 domain-containing protein [Fulvivirga sedimenti]MCA6074680.1 DUF4412 domain-containing protein [Fulvivirga sedimenti]MCA6075857.1 DUF4412 domain-containing protein [Fulvivirga sedimenti]MCA6076985.1 DUF4412 domain-containing protein [Fulvivirga sedimenti]